MNRLLTFDRGTLDGGLTSISGKPTRTLNWTLDALGNWDSLGGDESQDRTHNAQNQATTVGGNTLVYDANGNLTTDQNGKTLVYDAWNRLVASKTGGTTNISYSNDAFGRRISSAISGTTTDYYFSNRWQVLEERVGDTARVQYVWSPTYVNAMIERDRDSDNNGSLEERVYPTQDTNFNVTALVSSSGTIMERFQYDPYGKRTVLDASWSGTSDSYSFYHGFQGGKMDPVTGRINFQRRDYDVDLMRTIEADPARYVDGPNRYQWVRDNPLAGLAADRR